MSCPRPASSRRPVLHLPPDEIDALALRAAHGDRDAEDQALRAVTPFILSIICEVVKRIDRLNERREDLEQEAFMAATTAIRSYDGRCRLTTYLGWRVRGGVKHAAWQFYSPSGANVVRPRKGPGYDFGSPIFQAYEPITHMNRLPDDREVPAKNDFRFRLMHRLRKLTPVEKDVVLRHWGVPRERASRDSWTRDRAARARPETLKEIGADYGIGRETMRQIQAAAIRKLGIETLPDRAKVIRMAGDASSRAIQVAN